MSFGGDGRYISQQQDAWAPQRVSSSGRQIKLSDRAKSLVAAPAEHAFWTAVNEIDRYDATMVQMISTCTNPSAFKNCIVTWMSLYQNVKDAEDDMRRALSLERLRSMQPDIMRVHERCLDLRKRSYQHLDVLQLDMQEELGQSSKNTTAAAKTLSMFSPTASNSSKSRRSDRSNRSNRSDGSKKRSTNLTEEQRDFLKSREKRYEASMKEQIQVMENEMEQLSTTLRLRARNLVREALQKEEKNLSTVPEEGQLTSPKQFHPIHPVESEVKSQKKSAEDKFKLPSVKGTPEPIAASTSQKSKQGNNQLPFMNVGSPLRNYIGVRPKSPKIKRHVAKLRSPKKKLSPPKRVRKLKVPSPEKRSPPKVTRIPHSPYDRRLFSPPVSSFHQEFQEFLEWKAAKQNSSKGEREVTTESVAVPQISQVPLLTDANLTTHQEQLQPRVEQNSVRNMECEVPERYSRDSPSSASRSQSSDRSDAFIGAVSALTDALLKQQQINDDKILLPKVEPKVYSGNVLSFHIWLNSFQTLIEAKITCPKRRLLYLGKYVSGDAEEAIKPILDMPEGNDSYDNAISILKERFGCRIKIAEEFKRKLKKWPQIKDGDYKQLQRYSDFLGHCQSAMKSVGYLDILAQPEENVKLTEKLPVHLAVRWNREVVKYMQAEKEKGRNSPYPPFSEFCNFLHYEAKVAAGPCAPSQERFTKEKKTSLNTNATPSDSVPKNKGKNKKRNKSMQHNVPETDDKRAESTFKTKQDDRQEEEGSEDICYMCDSNMYMIEKCSAFLSLSPIERRDYLKKHVICFGCLRTKHDFRKCKERYNPLLRVVNPVNVKQNVCNDTQIVDSKDSGTSSKDVISHSVHTSPSDNGLHYSQVVPVLVSHVNKPSQDYLVYALIDTQSNGCFVTDHALRMLQVEGVPTELNVKSMGRKSKLQSSSVIGLTVSPHNSSEDKYLLPVCYSKDEIPFDTNSVPCLSVVKEFKHLSNIVPHMLDFLPNIPVGLLLGMNFSRAFRSRGDIIQGEDDEPWGMKTDLGWMVSGPVGASSSVPKFCFATQIQETSIGALRKAFDLDFLGPDSSESVSYEDTLFLRKMDEGFRIDEEGHVELPLPLRETASIPKGSRKVAYRRLMSQKPRLKSDAQYLKKYSAFFDKMFMEKHAEPAEPISEDEDLCFLLPHHGVFHPRKVDELRVVFDGSCEIDGICLNDLLLPGPDMTNNLVGVLVRFREGLEAFLCDIQGMFHQVRVTHRFRNLLRFFWFKNNDPNGPVVENRVCVHHFGATSSPACATYALRKVAEEYKSLFGIDVVEFIKKFFYVDDGLRSVDQADRALDIIFGAIELCGLGGFRLHKFACNNPDIVQHIPQEYLCKDLVAWQPGNPLPNQVCLGSHWSMHKDCFMYLLKLTKVTPTRRGMLSFVSSIYDPLGIISPVTLHGRQILQQLCRDKLSWDEKVTSDVLSTWDEWFLSLRILSGLMIPRCYKVTVSDVQSVELHMYSDAAEEGYGACAYLVLEDELSHRDVTLTLAKSRVKPLKTVTMPRLELQAAVLAVKMSEFLLLELPYENVKVYFWCDSMIVLAYIMHDGKRFRIYVANRVQYIRDRSLPKQWNYVESASNPADLASRGCKGDQLMANSLWFHGPETLKIPQMSNNDTYQVPDDDPELLKEKTVHNTVLNGYSISSCMARISSWLKMIRVMNTVRSGIRRWYNFIAKKKGRTSLLKEEDGVEARHRAKLCIIRHMQLESFPTEYTKILPGYPESMKECKVRKKMISSDGKNLRKLDVYMCQDDMVLKVGGRIRRSDIPLLQIHPYVIPHGHPITNTIIRFYHENSAHVGRNSTINLLRTEGWWVIHIRSAVSYVIKHCVDCKKLRGPVVEQKMAELPEDRLESSPPFTYCAVDLFGPFYEKDKRTIRKRWGSLFCCLVLRAVHIEICDDMTTDCFIKAYRRFANRRGPIRSLRCDRGSNIMGARGELDMMYSKLNQDAIKDHLLAENCDWIIMKPNAPKSSHMGGVWERLIGSVRRSVEGLLIHHTDQLNDDDLKTLMTEAECIVNSRPLTYVDVSNPDEPVAMTPSMLLTMKSKRLMAPFGKFVKEDKYSRQRWRMVQYLANQFWDRWKKEFLPLLQERPKWHKIHPCLREGDIVLMVEESQPRNCWPLARVVEVKKSMDDKVRSITIKTKDGIYDRPIRKVVLLYRPNN